MTDALGLHSREHLKPHHETLQTLIQNNHLNSGRTVYIGDTIYDVKSANASNIKSWEHNLLMIYYKKILIM